MSSYAFYVYGSYGFAGVVVALLIFWVWADGALRRRELASLEASSARDAAGKAGEQ